MEEANPPKTRGGTVERQCLSAAPAFIMCCQQLAAMKVCGEPESGSGTAIEERVACAPLCNTDAGREGGIIHESNSADYVRTKF